MFYDHFTLWVRCGNRAARSKKVFMNYDANLLNRAFLLPIETPIAPNRISEALHPEETFFEFYNSLELMSDDEATEYAKVRHYDIGQPLTIGAIAENWQSFKAPLSEAINWLRRLFVFHGSVLARRSFEKLSKTRQAIVILGYRYSFVMPNSPEFLGGVYSVRFKIKEKLKSEYEFPVGRTHVNPRSWGQE